MGRTPTSGAGWQEFRTTAVVAKYRTWPRGRQRCDAAAHGGCLQKKNLRRPTSGPWPGRCGSGAAGTDARGFTGAVATLRNGPRATVAMRFRHRCAAHAGNGRPGAHCEGRIRLPAFRMDARRVGTMCTPPLAWALPRLWRTAGRMPGTLNRSSSRRRKARGLNR